jgi:hypothetical protein
MKETNMADGSVTNHLESKSEDFDRPIAAATLMFGEDFLVDLDLLRREVDAEMLEDLAGRLGRFASAALHLARLRGENDSDMPETLSNAMGAAEICLQLSNGFASAARELKREVAHG